MKKNITTLQICHHVSCKMFTYNSNGDFFPSATVRGVLARSLRPETMGFVASALRTILWLQVSVQ